MPVSKVVRGTEKNVLPGESTFFRQLIEEADYGILTSCFTLPSGSLKVRVVSVTV